MHACLRSCVHACKLVCCHLYFFNLLVQLLIGEWGGVNWAQICLPQRLPGFRIFQDLASLFIFLCQPWSWILVVLATSWHQIATTFQTSAATKPPSPHFLALFSPNRWNVKCPFYGKKGFYGLTSGRFNRAKCAMSGRCRLNGPWLDGCFGSCVWEACSEKRICSCIMNDFCQLQTVFEILDHPWVILYLFDTHNISVWCQIITIFPKR